MEGRIGEAYENAYTIEDCSNLTGYTVKSLLAKFQFDDLDDLRYSDPETPFVPIPVELEQLEDLWRVSLSHYHHCDVDFHLEEVCKVVLPFHVIKKKRLVPKIVFSSSVASSQACTRSKKK